MGRKSKKSSKEFKDEELAALILECHETYNGILGYRRRLCISIILIIQIIHGNI